MVSDRSWLSDNLESQPDSFCEFTQCFAFASESTVSLHLFLPVLHATDSEQ